MFQRYPIQKFHREEGIIVFPSNLINRAYIGVIESGSGARLAAEAFQSLSVLRYIIGKKFKRDKAAERGVFGLVNHAHTAATELLDDAIVRDGSSDHLWRILRW